MPRSASFLPCVCTEAVCCGRPGDPSASPSRHVTCSFGPQQQLVSRPATVRPDPHRRGQCAPSSQQGPGARSRRGFSSAAIQTLCRRPPAGPLLGSASGHRHPEHCFRSQQLDAQGWSHFQVGLPAAALPEPRVWDSAGLRPGLRAGASAGPSLLVPPGRTRAGSTPVQPRPSGCVGARPRLRETPPKGPPNPSRGHLCALRMSLTRRTCTGHSL